MNRAVMQPDGASAVCHALEDALLNVACCKRRREVDRFLEKRAVERVGFVENRKRMKSTVFEDSFDGVLRPRNERLHKRTAMCVVAFDQHIGRLEQPAQATKRLHALICIINPHHAATP